MAYGASAFCSFFSAAVRVVGGSQGCFPLEVLGLRVSGAGFGVTGRIRCEGARSLGLGCCNPCKFAIKER